VTIAGGQTSATFKVTTAAVGSQKSVTITGKLGVSTQTATLTVVPPVLASLAVSPASVTGGASSTGTVALSGIAPSGGLVVKLSSNQGSVKAPASVTVPAGKSTATFTVTTTAVASQTSATLNASLNGISQSATLVVNPPTLKGLVLSPSAVVGGKSSTGTLTLTGLAPAGGLVVTLTSSSASATVPATVTVPAGKASVGFTVKTSKVGAKTAATISASLGTATESAVLTIS